MKTVKETLEKLFIGNLSRVTFTQHCFDPSYILNNNVLEKSPYEYIKKYNHDSLPVKFEDGTEINLIKINIGQGGFQDEDENDFCQNSYYLMFGEIEYDKYSWADNYSLRFNIYLKYIPYVEASDLADKIIKNLSLIKEANIAHNLSIKEIESIILKPNSFIIGR